ncbi:hypothetical protein [Roseibium sp. RKSG952]|uniref:hypothetical protein n=1 Tax=Roseibium sp. RKSG952 TaxID=2529384 RepID=UPI0012BD2632|nr:hypothetical protein [Roseibium sp. RKSG952]MTH95480.1 hypothetical protein [Roseibium sp. RKSG952]
MSNSISLKRLAGLALVGIVCVVTVLKGVLIAPPLTREIRADLSCVDGSVSSVFALIREEMETDILRRAGVEHAFRSAHANAVTAASHLDRMEGCLARLAESDGFAPDDGVLRSAELFAGASVVAFTLRGEALVTASTVGVESEGYAKKLAEMETAWTFIENTGTTVLTWVGESVSGR